MFDDIIKDKANEHEAPVPPDAWDNIAKKKKKRRFGFGWWSGALIILLGLSTAGYIFMNNKNGSSINRGKEEQLAKRQESNGQGSKKQEDKNQMPLKEENADAGNEANRDITMTDGNDTRQSIVIAEKAKTRITVSSNDPEENNNTVAGSNKKTKTIKGKLKATQTNPGIEEDVAANENIQAKIDKPVIEEPIEEISSEESKQVTIAAVTDKKITTAEDEKKTSEPNNNKKENPEKTVQLKKENTTATKQKLKKHWFIEAAAMPLLASSSYKDNISFNRTLALNNTVSVYKANLVKASIEPSVSFLLLVRKQMNKKITVGTGLQYMLLKENMSIAGKETNTTHTYVDRLVNGRLVPDTIITTTEGSRNITAVNSYQLFSIPLFVQYNIIEKKQWSVGAVGGFYFNISSNYKNEINRNAAAPLLGAPGTTNKSNKGMDIFAGLRISKKLSKRIDLFAMPSMRWSMAKYNIKNSLLDKNINQAGVGFGMCYKIK